MGGIERHSADDPLIDALAAFDDQLADGWETPPDAIGESVDPSVLSEWHRLSAFLTLVEKAWRRGSDGQEQPVDSCGSTDAADG